MWKLHAQRKDMWKGKFFLEDQFNLFSSLPLPQVERILSRKGFQGPFFFVNWDKEPWIFIFRGERCSKFLLVICLMAESVLRATEKCHRARKHKNLCVLTVLSFSHLSFFPEVLFTYTVIFFKWVVMKNNVLGDDWNWSSLTCESPWTECILNSTSQSGV